MFGYGAWTRALVCGLVCWFAPVQAEDVAMAPAALYGEAGVVQAYAEPALRSGHDALRPLTDAMSGYFGLKQRLSSDYGLSYIIEYSPQFQWDQLGNGAGGYTGNDETNVIVQWSPVEPSNPKAGTLALWYQISRTLGDKTTGRFMNDAGILSPINGGDTSPNKSNDLIHMLTWEQWFMEDSLRLGVGKLTTRTFLNLNRYAVSDREDFMNVMFVNNPVVPFTARNGMGLFTQYHLDDAYLTGMLREADGTSTGVSFDTLDSGNWEYAAELGLTPDNLAGLGAGIYRITAYYTDGFGRGATRSPSGWAWSLSFDQDIGDDLGALFRYAYATEDWRAYRQRAVAGVQIKQPWRYQHDRVGLGAWWGEPTANNLDPEYGLELFYKAQLAPYLEVGPDLQLILNPQLDKSRSSAFIAGLRVRVVL